MTFYTGPTVRSQSAFW